MKGVLLKTQAIRPLSSSGPIQLLIFQPTPFCNINCRYCYLPDRSSTKRISLDTVAQAARRASEAGLFSERVGVVWHAGEPLVLPPEFYADAIRSLRANVPASVAIQHTIQTNGTLIDEQWCRFFIDHNVRVGLSLDGPAFVHDAARITRSGTGTFDKVIRALQMLQEWNIQHYVLAVLSSISIRHPDEMYEFFCSVKVRDLGFNVEEIEGVHKLSSLSGDEPTTFSTFMSRFYDRCCRGGSNSPRIREFRQLEGLLLKGDLAVEKPLQQLTPYRIVCVDVDGNFSTFSPELLGMSGPPRGDYVLGNVYSHTFAEALLSDKFMAIEASIQRGRQMCRGTCSFFKVCGGGSPSNKLSENGSFASTETLQCRLRVKQLATIVLGKLEQRFGLASAGENAEAEICGVSGDHE